MPGEILIDIYMDGSRQQNDEYAKKIAVAEKFGFDIVTNFRETGMLGASRNMLIKLAKSEFIIFLDGDDYLVSENLLWMLNLLNNNLSDSNVLLFQIQVDNLGVVSPWHFDAYPGMTQLNQKDLLVWFSKSGWRLSSACAKLYRRDWLVENKLFFIEELFYEDTPFWFEVVTKLDSLDVLNLNIYGYRRWGSTQITNSSGKRLFDIFSIYELIERLADQSGKREIEIAFRSFVVDYAFWTIRACGEGSLSRKNLNFLKQQIAYWIKRVTQNKEVQNLPAEAREIKNLLNWHKGADPFRSSMFVHRALRQIIVFLREVVN
jgi:glycosyltransferase involved in cell wall biosynthesis